MIQTPLGDTKVDDVWEAKGLNLFEDVLLFCIINYFDITIFLPEGMSAPDIFISFIWFFIICTFRNGFLWGSLLTY